MTHLSSPDIHSVSFTQVTDARGEGRFTMGNDLFIADSVDAKELSEAPVQLGFLLLSLCTSGEIDLNLGESRHHIRQGDLFIALGGQVVSDFDATPDFRATVVIMSLPYAQDCIVGLSYLWPYLLYIMKQPVVALSDEEQVWITDCYQLLRRRLHRKPGKYLRETIASLTRAFYFEICDLLDRRMEQKPTKTQSRSYAVFDHFIRLASQHFRQQRMVEWYSSEMCLTPKHLSEVVKAVSGRTAGQWLTTFVMIEIKTLLQHSHLSIKEIATEMGFPNQSFLGKYFKNVEGISPSEFRKLHQ